MKEATVIGGSLGLAILTAGAVGLLLGSTATVFGGTPIGIAVYLVIGVGLPQYYLSRETGDPTQLGLATLSVAGGVLAMLGSLALGSATAETGVGHVLLFVVVFGSVLGAIVREFRAGYRTES
ncbi:hypothetical protein GS429_05170 [Natronorubrum sp. JWXQ-INN-674]|uniref:Uncharacterized protein n=1 Tax=Natronorubrum halalkaliphilum TaxID=2691917 RepID=A0A6B0VKZ8_9EURY|nr:hypothetical protein [Natronorubrum halalkaliphilum]MXV61462.1 hypothetical protein [Natronorubrum halalkaliphilum]